MPRLFHATAVATDKLRIPYATPTKARPARTHGPAAFRGAPPTFATAEKRRPAGRIGSAPQPPVAKPFHRVLHRLSTNDFKDLSPENFHAALLFPCATQAGRANLPLPQRIARHRAGRKGLRVTWAGRSGFGPGRIVTVNGTPVDGGWSSDRKLSLVSQGPERATTGLRAPSGCDGSLNRRKLVGMPGDGRTDQEGVRVCRKARAKTASEHLAPFLIPLFRSSGTQRDPPVSRGSRPHQGCTTASVAPVSRAIARMRAKINEISWDGGNKPQHVCGRPNGSWCRRFREKRPLTGKRAAREAQNPPDSRGKLLQASREVSHGTHSRHRRRDCRRLRALGRPEPEPGLPPLGACRPVRALGHAGWQPRPSVSRGGSETEGPRPYMSDWTSLASEVMVAPAD